MVRARVAREPPRRRSEGFERQKMGTEVKPGSQREPCVMRHVSSVFGSGRMSLGCRSHVLQYLRDPQSIRKAL